jgi:hypothetical protein
MKYISLKAGSKGFFNLIIMFVFTVLFNASAFGQSSQKLADLNNEKVYINAKEEKVAINSSSNSLNFVLWFMGTKQGPKPIVNQSFFKESGRCRQYDCLSVNLFKTVNKKNANY